jgi:hypothetical protein
MTNYHLDPARYCSACGQFDGQHKAKCRYATTPLAVPLCHSNGTSRQDLLEQVTKAREAVIAALEALCAAAPNGRDYYPLGTDATGLAISQHEARILHLKAVEHDLTDIWAAIEYQILQYQTARTI